MARPYDSLQYQNSLRALEFVALAKAAGLEIIYKRTAVRPGTTDARLDYENSTPVSALFNRRAGYYDTRFRRKEALS